MRAPSPAGTSINNAAANVDAGGCIRGRVPLHTPHGSAMQPKRHSARQFWPHPLRCVVFLVHNERGTVDLVANGPRKQSHFTTCVSWMGSSHGYSSSDMASLQDVLQRHVMLRYVVVRSLCKNPWHRSTHTE